MSDSAAPKRLNAQLRHRECERAVGGAAYIVQLVADIKSGSRCSAKSTAVA